MLYRRSPLRSRKYVHSENAPAVIDSSVEEKSAEAAAPEKPVEPKGPSEERAKPSSAPPHIRFFKSQIFLDEIILLGLLFLLFEEGVEDELLLIVVVYLLLTGRD